MRIVVITHQWGHLLAVHRLADVVFDQHGPVDRTPALRVIRVRKTRHAGRVMGGGKARSGQLVGIALELFCDARFDGCGRVVVVVVIEVCANVLWVIHIAVITLAIVFPDKFPVGLNLVVHRAGDLRAI